MDLSLNNQLLLIGFNVLVVSLLLIWYAYGNQFVLTDQASSRSLHQGQALTGAGFFIFIPLSVFILIGYTHFLLAYLIGLMSVLGFLDDKYDLSFKLRLLIQAVIIMTCLWLLGHDFSALFVFLSLCMLWWINLFNFMDGANGMAGLHAWVVAVFYVFILHTEPVAYFISLSLVFLLFVYLLFNMYLKKLFMGDSGSLPLALVLGLLAMLAIQNNTLSYPQVAVIHAVFIVDATLTLFYRLKKGDNITQAHASHLYQRLIKAGRSHEQVSIWYASITALLCAVVYLTAALSLVVQYGILLMVYLLLLLIFMKYLSIGR